MKQPIFNSVATLEAGLGKFHNVQDLKGLIWGLPTLKYASMPGPASYLTHMPNMGVKSPYGGLRRVTCKRSAN